MKHYDINRLQGLRRNHNVHYKAQMKETFGKKLTWAQMEEKSDDEIRSFLLSLNRRIQFSTSPLDMKRLANAILTSRSGIGGSAMTAYTCGLCGKDDVWGNTAVPKICHACAEKMAEHMIMGGAQVLKEALLPLLYFQHDELLVDLDVALFEMEQEKSKHAGVTRQSDKTLKEIRVKLSNGSYIQKKVSRV